MSKFYTVMATTTKMVLVEVTDDQTPSDAMQVVSDEFPDAEIEMDLSTPPMVHGTEEWDRAKRHADEVMWL